MSSTIENKLTPPVPEIKTTNPSPVTKTNPEQKVTSAADMFVSRKEITNSRNEKLAVENKQTSDANDGEIAQADGVSSGEKEAQARQDRIFEFMARAAGQKIEIIPDAAEVDLEDLA